MDFTLVRQWLRYRFVCSCVCLDIFHISPPLVKTISPSHLCPECGFIFQSGKTSCCGHGGSWFGNCGSAGNTKLGHLWSEGIRACKVQKLQAAVGQQVHASQATNNGSSDDRSIGIDSGVSIVTPHIFAPTAIKTPTAIPAAAEIDVLANMSIITSARKSILYNAGSTTSKTIYRVVTTIMYASMDVPMLDPKISRVNAKIKSIHESCSSSITARETEELLHTIIILIIVCFYWVVSAILHSESYLAKLFPVFIFKMVIIISFLHSTEGAFLTGKNYPFHIMEGRKDQNWRK